MTESQHIKSLGVGRGTLSQKNRTHTLDPQPKVVVERPKSPWEQFADAIRRANNP